MTERPAVRRMAERATSPDLPKYKRPPVVEVAMSVQFEELTGFQPVHFGLFYEVVRERYPRTEYHPPLASVVELFGAPGTRRSSLSVESENFPTGRCWYLSEDGLRLVQLQPDRFVLNWRKLDSDTEYPSYETLREMFRNELELFLGFVADRALGNFEPTQCELTYVNHVTSEQGWRGFRDLADILAPWSGRTLESYLPEVEDARLNWSYRFEENGSPIGRLHVQCNPAIRTRDRTLLLVLQLTARGAPLGEGLDGALAITDRGHEWIVHGFTSITTEQMHQRWERWR